MRGFFAIGIENSKTPANIGTLWRSANIMGAAFIFTVGERYSHQRSDVLKTWKHIPLMHYADIGDLMAHLPGYCDLVGVEMGRVTPLHEYKHPERAVYLLGAEDKGLSSEAMAECSKLVVLPGERSMNVSVAGSIVMYDRITKGG